MNRMVRATSGRPASQREPYGIVPHMNDPQKIGEERGINRTCSHVIHNPPLAQLIQEDDKERERKGEND